MIDLHNEPTFFKNKIKISLRYTKFDESLKQILRTSCNHKFHVTAEMDKIKAICPICRRTLPDL